MKTSFMNAAAASHDPVSDALDVRLARRLAQLRVEQHRGQEMLAQLDADRQRLSETLLRIAGAVQVLEEELSAGGHPPVTPLPTHIPVA
jgi:hypothetical protein